MIPRHPPLKIGIGGPVGSGKTALAEALCRRLRDRFDMAVITNDIYTKEDAEFLVRRGALPPERMVGVETGGCPHTAIREDASVNLEAIRDLLARFPDLDLLLVESGGDNLAATFSPELVDATIYVIDVAEGEKIPRKGGPGIMRSDLLVINKIDLAPHVGADLAVMAGDAAPDARQSAPSSSRTSDGRGRRADHPNGSARVFCCRFDRPGADRALARVGRDGRLCLRFARRGDRTVLAHAAFTAPLHILAPVACLTRPRWSRCSIPPEDFWAATASPSRSSRGLALTPASSPRRRRASPGPTGRWPSRRCASPSNPAAVWSGCPTTPFRLPAQRSGSASMFT